MNKFNKLNEAAINRACALAEKATNDPEFTVKMMRKENALLGRVNKFCRQLLKDAKKSKDLGILEDFELPEEFKALFPELIAEQNPADAPTTPPQP